MGRLPPAALLATSGTAFGATQDSARKTRGSTSPRADLRTLPIPAQGGSQPPPQSFWLHPIMGYTCLPRSGRALVRSLLAGPAPTARLGTAMVSPSQPRSPWLGPTPPNPSLAMPIGLARVGRPCLKSKEDLSRNFKINYSGQPSWANK